MADLTPEQERKLQDLRSAGESAGIMPDPEMRIQLLRQVVQRARDCVAAGIPKETVVVELSCIGLSDIKL